MRGLRSTIAWSAIGMLAAALNAFAAEISLSRSAWTSYPVQADPGLHDPLLQRGQEVFQALCQACHGEIPEEIVPGGLPSMPGTQALQATYQGQKPAMLDQRSDLTPEMIAAFVRNGVGSMPPFRPTEFPDQDLEALGAYLARNRPWTVLY